MMKATEGMYKKGKWNFFKKPVTKEILKKHFFFIQKASSQ